MSMYSLLQNKPVPTVPDIEDALAGNLCRCTGYRPILDAFVPFSKGDTSSETTTKANGKAQCHQAVCRGTRRVLNGSNSCAQKNGCSGTEVPKQLSGALYPYSSPLSPFTFRYQCTRTTNVLNCEAFATSYLLVCKRWPSSFRLGVATFTCRVLQVLSLRGIDVRHWSSYCSARHSILMHASWEEILKWASKCTSRALPTPPS